MWSIGIPVKAMGLQEDKHAQQKPLKALFSFFPFDNLPLSKPNLKNILEYILNHKKLK